MLSINLKIDTLLFTLLLAFFVPTYFQTDAMAQATEQVAQSPNVATSTHNLAVPSRQPRRITALRVTNIFAGSRLSIVSDVPLDDYTAYHESDRFYVVIPRAEISATGETIKGLGFTSAEVEQHGDSVLLRVHLQVDATARVSQSLNQIDIFFDTQTNTVNSEKVGERAIQNSTTALSSVAEESSANLNGDTVRQMLRRIEDLEARIRELEARQPQGASSQAVATTTTSRQDATPPAVLDPSAASPASVNNSQAGTQAGAATHDDHADLPGGTPHLQIQGFAEVNYRATNEKGRTNAFSLGQLDLFITSRLSERFSVLSELILEAGEDNAFTFEIHRLLLKYSLNDYFNLSAGRYHTAIGYYNTAYHHGSWFQTTANRPFLFAFESRGGILPLHNVGVTATGRIPSAPLGLRYVAEIGNGRSSTPGSRPVQTAVDENNGKAFNLGIFARPSQVPGLQTGFSVYRDRLTPSGRARVGQTIMAAHLVYQGARNEFLNEALAIRHASGGKVFYIPGFYTQFSRRFGDLRPFFRYQYVNVPSDDPIFRSVGRRNGPSVGVRYDLSDFVNFKMQYDRTARRGLSTLDEIILQLAFTF